MKTIALISQKGGSGKTTLSISLVVAAERAGVPSVLVDLDPQASAGQWSDLREAETPVVTCAPPARLPHGAPGPLAGRVRVWWFWIPRPTQRMLRLAAAAGQRLRAHSLPAIDG